MLKVRYISRGFTIVELLIAIVVIAILAAITIVAYNGIQQRAKNTQTISAITAYAKAIKLYEADKGDLGGLNFNACLGETYGYGPDGTDTSGTGQCRQDTATSGIKVNANFYTALAPYMSSKPQPDTSVTYVISSVNWFRGAYYYPASPHRIDFVLVGVVDCPATIGGLTLSSRSTTAFATRCVMTFPGT